MRTAFRQSASAVFLSQETDLSLIHDLASVSVMNSSIWICSPWGSVMRTYHPGSAFNWTGSNFVLGLSAPILSLWKNSATRAGANSPRHIQTLADYRAAFAALAERL